MFFWKWEYESKNPLTNCYFDVHVQDMFTHCYPINLMSKKICSLFYWRKAMWCFIFIICFYVYINNHYWSSTNDQSKILTLFKFFFFMVSMTEFNDIDLSNQTLSFIYNDTSTHGCTFCNIKRHRLLSRRRLVIKTIFIWVLVSMIYTIFAISFFWLILAMMTHKCFDLFENIINIGVFLWA